MYIHNFIIWCIIFTFVFILGIGLTITGILSIFGIFSKAEYKNCRFECGNISQQIQINNTYIYENCTASTIYKQQDYSIFISNITSDRNHTSRIPCMYPKKDPSKLKVCYDSMDISCSGFFDSSNYFQLLFGPAIILFFIVFIIYYFIHQSIVNTGVQSSVYCNYNLCMAAKDLMVRYTKRETYIIL